MKNFIAFLLMTCACMASPKNALAQYHSVFGDSSTEWSIINQTSCRSLHSTQYYEGQQFEPRKDTVINGATYFFITAWDIDYAIRDRFFLREDTVAGRVWFYTVEGQMEYLVMDLSLVKGDTFKVRGRNDTLSFVADSVYFLNNLKHIRLNGEHTFCQKINQQFTFIEGTGTSAGLFYPGWWRNEDSVSSYLLCHYKNAAKVYDNNYLAGKCLILGLSEELNSFNNLKIYPNPLKNFGLISFDNKERNNVEFSIYDVSGKYHYQTQCREDQIQFSTKKFRPGVYFYQLKSQDGKIASGKIIVQ